MKFRRPCPPLFEARYQLLEVMGHGADSAVHRALQRDLDREVVVKIFWAHGEFAAEAVERVRQEARILASVHHPHVVELLDHGVEGDFVYLTYPDERGRSLESRLHDSSWRDEARIRTLMRECLEGLTAVHALGVLHRDLKPANVILTESGEARLIDFGLAKDLSQGLDLTASGDFVGTPLYAAPEQHAGKPPDARTDLYALGLIAYRLAVGTHPFDAPNLRGVLDLKLASVPPPPRDAGAEISPGLSAWITRMIQRRAEDRLGSAREALVALRRSEGAVPGPGQQGTLELTDPSTPARGPADDEGDVAASRAEGPTRSDAAARGLGVLGLGLLLAVGLRSLSSSPPTPAPEPPRASTEPACPKMTESLTETCGRQLQELRLKGSPGERDPLWRETHWYRIPALRALLATESSRELGEVEAARLRQLDVLFEGRGLGRPFFPFAYLSSPTGSGPIPDSLKREVALLSPGLGPQVASGWSLLALRSLERFLALEDQTDEEVAAMIDGHPPDTFPADLDLSRFAGIGIMVLTLSPGDRTLKYVSLVAQERDARLALEVYFKEMTDQLHSACVAASRALRSGEPGAALAAVLVVRALDPAPGAWLSRLGYQSLHTLLGEVPPGPAGALLAAEIVHQLESMRAHDLRLLETRPLPAPFEPEPPSVELYRRAAEGDIVLPLDAVRIEEACRRIAYWHQNHPGDPAVEDDQARVRRRRDQLPQPGRGELERVMDNVGWE